MNFLYKLFKFKHLLNFAKGELEQFECLAALLKEYSFISGKVTLNTKPLIMREYKIRRKNINSKKTKKDIIREVNNISEKVNSNILEALKALDIQTESIEKINKYNNLIEIKTYSMIVDIDLLRKNILKNKDEIIGNKRFEELLNNATEHKCRFAIINCSFTKQNFGYFKTKCKDKSEVFAMQLIEYAINCRITKEAKYLKNQFVAFNNLGNLSTRISKEFSEAGVLVGVIIGVSPMFAIGKFMSYFQPIMLLFFIISISSGAVFAIIGYYIGRYFDYQNHHRFLAKIEKFKL